MKNMKFLVLLFILVLAGCGVKVSNLKSGEIVNKIYTPTKTEVITVYEHDPITGYVLPKSYENVLEQEKFEFEIVFTNDDGAEETLVMSVSRYDFSIYEIGDEYKFFPPKSPPE